MSQIDEIQDTGERMVPDFHKGTVMYAEHLTRYLSAKQIVDNKVVLDIACGSGYGTHLLAESAQTVYGVDIDAGSIKYAKANFAGPNIEYKIGDGERIPLEDGSIDVVVTFETIEHIEDYSKFLKEVKRVLKPEGLMILSTPNALEFTKGNHYHLHEFEYDELVKEVKKDFKNVESYYQGTWVYVAIGPESMVRHEGEFNIPTHNFLPLPKEKDLYFYLLCSNREITEKIEPIGAMGGHYSARELVDIQNLQDKNLRDHQTVLANSQAENKRIMDEYAILTDQHKQLERDCEMAKKSVGYRIENKLRKALRHVAKKS